MMKLWIPAFAALMAAFFMPAQAQQNNQLWQPVSSTPDHVVTATATSEVVFPAPLKFVAIKNECVSDIYFDLTGSTFDVTQPATPGRYPLRLQANESFSGPFSTFTIGVSPASGNSADCTFTIQGGR